MTFHAPRWNLLLSENNIYITQNTSGGSIFRTLFRWTDFESQPRIIYYLLMTVSNRKSCKYAFFLSWKNGLRDQTFTENRENQHPPFPCDPSAFYILSMSCAGSIPYIFRHIHSDHLPAVTSEAHLDSPPPRPKKKKQPAIECRPRNLSGEKKNSLPGDWRLRFKKGQRVSSYSVMVCFFGRRFSFLT